jgi:membrane protease YdiL (CAAX protease family)
VAAPIAEEFFFRVLLQGWLEKRWPVDNPADDSADSQATRTVRWTPILISAAVFALLHLGRSTEDMRTDPIPLFVLAMMLGWVYQRTHRIWPSVVVHVCLNGLSTLALAADVLLRK